MNVEIITTPYFERDAKKLIKKYRSLKGELEQLIDELEADPRAGIHIKENVYKIRLAVKSKGKGKSGGMRVITFVDVALIEIEETTDVYLLSIYDKSERENIPDARLSALVEEIQAEVDKMKWALGIDSDKEEES